MKRAVPALAVSSAAVFATVALAAGLNAASTRITAALNAKQEVPRQAVNVRNASGSFSGTLVETRRGYRLSWRITFENLSGRARFAHVHRGRPGIHGPALIFLCGPCVSGAHGSAHVSAPEARLILERRTYVTIRTKRNPAGEIRGQISKSG
jgi:CHRD domain